MIAYWPGVTKPGAIARQYVCVEDFFPTILELAGVSANDIIQRVDGVSFVPSLRESDTYDDSRTLLWHFPSNWAQGDATIRRYFPSLRIEDLGMGPATAVRKGDWKLIYFYGNKMIELYNLKDDIGETKDLGESTPEKVRELFDIMISELKAKDAQYPIDEQTGQTVLPQLKSFNPLKP